MPPNRPTAPGPRPMRPADIAAIVVVEELDVTADGSTAVVARRTVRRGRYETHLWVVDLAGRSRPRQLTTGGVRDGSPRISPDGQRVVFVRSDAHDDDAPNHVCAASIRTGRVRTRAGGTPGVGSIGEVEWSPDGTRLAFTAAVDPLRFVVGDRPAVGSTASRSSKLAGARGAPDHPRELAVGRGGAPRPVVAPVRDRRHGWRRPAGDPRRLGGQRHHVAPRRAHGGLRRRISATSPTSPRSRRSGRSTSMPARGRSGRTHAWCSTPRVAQRDPRTRPTVGGSRRSGSSTHGRSMTSARGC